MGEFQAALDGSPEAQAILFKYGMTTGEVAFMAVMVWFTIALIKKHTMLTGVWLLLSAAVASVFWFFVIGTNYLPREVVGPVVVMITASGGCQKFKDVTGKIQFGGTRPRGEIERGPTKR